VLHINIILIEMITMITPEEISRKMVREMETRLGGRLRKVILIGSMARGDNTPESDYDCIAVVDEITSDLIDTIDEISGEMLYMYNSVFSIIPISEARYNEQNFNPLLINAGREGVVIWPAAV
jgi:predicted nucleotidyltransferase